MKRIDHYLTRKAAAVWKGSVVEDWDRSFVLIRPHVEGRPLEEAEPVVLSGPPTPLDKRFSVAREALGQLIEQARATP